MTYKELIDAIALTSGFAGVNEYEKLNVPDFLEWYRVNTSFDTEESKLIAQQVIEYLENGFRYDKANTVLRTYKKYR